MHRASRLRCYLATLAADGMDPAALLEGTGLQAAALSEPESLVSPEQYGRMVANLLSVTGNGGIAFRLGARSRISELGIVGYAMVSSTTLRHALELWSRYAQSLVGTLWSVHEVEQGPHHFTVEIVERVPTPGGLPFCVEEFIAMAQTIGQALSGHALQFQQLALSYPPPPHADRYHELCACPIHFSAPHTRLTLPRDWVELPLQTSDREFNEICQQHCSQIIRQITQGSPLLSRLRTLLLHSPGALPSLEAAARTLGMSSRSLRRHLQEEGQSYHHLVAAFRTELAREYLQDAHLSNKEIAYLLGFASSNAFQRAFKLWTGMTTGEYRAKAAASHGRSRT